MNLSTSKLQAFANETCNVITKENSSKIKGGAWYWCCDRNKWVGY